VSGVALCVIARDEERALPGLLQSVEGVVDTVVLVDTGSVDGTVALAEAAGATVVSTPWEDDFAAARNAALPALHASGAAWMLVLDADERLAPGAGAALRAAVDGDGFDRGFLRLHNATTAEADPAAVLSGRARRGQPTALARLFRVGPDLRYVRALHESVPADWLGRPCRDRVLAVDIVHLGYADDAANQADKLARNLRILRRMCAAAPDDTAAWAYRAREAARAGDPDEARTAADQAWTLLQARPRPLPAASFTVAALRADLLLQQGKLDEARATAETAAGWEQGHPSVWFLAGVCHLHLALGRRAPGPRRRHLRAAAQWLDRCLAADGRVFRDEVSAGATSWAAACRRGEVALLAGDTAAARACFLAAHEALPRPPVGLAEGVGLDLSLGLAECHVLAGEGAQALRVLQPLLRLPISDGWALASRACAQLGATADAQQFAGRARQLGAFRGRWRAR
jgi:tetratricopeptide (TPR) repeat protein